MLIANILVGARACEAPFIWSETPEGQTLLVCALPFPSFIVSWSCFITQPLVDLGQATLVRT